MSDAGYDTINGQRGPRCPNHRVHLVDCNMKDGTGICPISGAHFTFDHQEYEKTRKLRLTALGTMEEVGDWKLHQTDGDNG